MNPDIMVIKRKLNNSLINKIKYYETVISTNKIAMEMENVQEGTVIIGGEQSKGRGRLDRNWHSPKSGLWFSIILKPDKNKLDKAAILTLIGALSVYEAIINLNINADLKWPNDILYKNKKLCGILSQFKSKGNKVDRIVVGIGVNVNQKVFPKELADTSTSLRLIKGKKINKETFLADILNKFGLYYEKFENNEINDIINNKWKSNMSMLHKVIIFSTSDKYKYKGEVVDITDKGELVVKKDNGTLEKFIAGDVSIDKNSLSF
jgi:BirA family biotin operon repressor/biotin-[acetyl-CoA-carboxylase] ligase